MPSADDDRTPGRSRGRPRRDSATPPLTRALIAETALDLVADEGFSALTMRNLASRLGVTVRALYNHVTDRQDVIDLLAALMMELQSEHDLDVGDWRTSVRGLYRNTREQYRRIGRALLFPLAETVTPSELHPHRILRSEQLLAFLTDLGLAIEDALAWHAQFLIDVFGYALLIDYRYDRSDERTRRAMQDPVPKEWLDAHPDIEAPVSRSATLLPDWTSDELFERMADRAIIMIESLRTTTPER
ncbi:TetR/AcrR family transcriptional regulator [Rhodococcus artemisiae]|uniref:TetR family transcriptional regulator n=1 Tax=Rhodococcus artemisiae TaxID=714159 RepID=A0ABU7LCI5_9NOCA|nr:TetR family transcriptional regulator [Rhodococcus artemisiae]MEE2058617.1 TetR family transcriptional regulator [Rhodococcus artemisiae]